MSRSIIVELGTQDRGSNCGTLNGLSSSARVNDSTFTILVIYVTSLGCEHIPRCYFMRKDEKQYLLCLQVTYV